MRSVVIVPQDPNYLQPPPTNPLEKNVHVKTAKSQGAWADLVLPTTIFPVPSPIPPLSYRPTRAKEDREKTTGKAGCYVPHLLGLVLGSIESISKHEINDCPSVVSIEEQAKTFDCLWETTVRSLRRDPLEAAMVTTGAKSMIYGSSGGP